MHIEWGSRRIVFVFKNFVIKIPKLTSWLSFILGIMENLNERYWWCADGVLEPANDWYSDTSATNHLAQIYWADRFGFFVIMEKVGPLKDIPDQADKFENAAKIIINRYKGLDIIDDIKPSNIGIRKNGRPVLIDYGYFKSINQTYLGRKVIKKFK